MQDQSLVGPTAPRRRRVVSMLIYLLAGLGLLSLAVFGYSVYQGVTGSRSVIDEEAVIDKAMVRNYGRYSEAQKGWLYVAENNRPYVMRVVQHALIKQGGAGDGVYFVASGDLISGWADGSVIVMPAIYGTFYIRADGGADGSMHEIGKPVITDSVQAPQPGDIRFEALSDHLWAWVVKVQDEVSSDAGEVVVRNHIWAPIGDEIDTLASFPASAEVDPLMPCAQANAEFDAAARSGTVAEVDMPLRCEHLRWTYSTAAIHGKTPVPITVTVSGIHDGQPVATKSWKLIFNHKSDSYQVPDELYHAR